jgi:hypothetical protein
VRCGILEKSVEAVPALCSRGSLGHIHRLLSLAGLFFQLETLSLCFSDKRVTINHLKECVLTPLTVLDEIGSRTHRREGDVTTYCCSYCS